MIRLSKKEAKLVIEVLAAYLEMACMDRKSEQPYVVLGDRLYAETEAS